MTTQNPGPAVTTTTNSTLQAAAIGPTTGGPQFGGTYIIPATGVAGDGVADPTWGSIGTPSAAALANVTATFIRSTDLSRWVVNSAQTALTQLEFTPQTALSLPQVPIYNFNPANYQHLRAALANFRASGTGFKVICLGDSTTAGVNPGTTNILQQAYPRRLADILTKNGLNAGWQNFIGDHLCDPPNTSDPRVVLNGTWSTGVGNLIGGNAFDNSSDTTALAFTPTVNTDTFEMYYIQTTLVTLDSLVVKSGTGGTTACSTGGSVTPGTTQAVKTLVSTYTAGANIWTTQKANSNSNNAFIVGGSAYLSTSPEISLLNCGVSGVNSSYFAASTSGYDALHSMTVSGSAFYGLPLCIYTIGINDWNAGSTQAATYANLSTLITALQAGGTDVLLVVPVPSSIVAASLANQATVIAAIYQASATFNCAVVDLTSRWVSEAIANPLGYYGSAGAPIHPSTQGYADVASAISQFLLAL